LAAQYGEDILLGLDRALEARRDGVFDTAEGGRVLDIRYQDIRGDLIGAIGRIYDQLGWNLGAEAEARMRTFLAAHPGDQAGSLKRYTFAETGLDEGEYRERAKAYQEYFEVETEQLD
ncbi:MAG: hypothetical protein ACJ72L_05255, partial [Marmoricola sp.]